MIKTILWLSILGSFCASAEPPTTNSSETVKAIHFQGGIHTEFYNNVQSDSSGGVRKIDFAPTIGGGVSLPLNSDWLFIPEVNWVLPRAAGSSRIIKNLLMFRSDLGYETFSWLRLRAGTSLMWQNLHGRGGSTTISNGSTSSTFYYPDENRSALNNTLDLGAELLLSEEITFRLQTYIYSFFREESRQLSYTLFLTYYWKQ